MKAVVYTGIGSVLKSSEGGPGGKATVDMLKSNGIKARTCPSPYVGHIGIEIAETTKGVEKKALKLIFG